MENIPSCNGLLFLHVSTLSEASLLKSVRVSLKLVIFSPTRKETSTKFQPDTCIILAGIHFRDLHS